MPFHVGQRVRLTRPDDDLPAGSPGTVQAFYPVGNAYDVFFDAGGLRREPESALTGAGGAPFGARVAASPQAGGAEEAAAAPPAAVPFAQLLAALPEFRNDLLQRQQEALPGAAGVASAFAARGAFSAFATAESNIHATGVGLRRRGGKIVEGELALKVFVFEKVAVEAFGPQGAPAPDWQGMPVDYEHLPVQLVRAKAGGAGKGRGGKGRGGKGDAQAGGTGGGTNPQRRRHRPVVGGLSISPLDAPFVGTLGCFLRRRVLDTDEFFALSNNHVLADVDRLPVGTPIVQPGPEVPPFRTDIKDQFATLHTALPIRFPTGTAPLAAVNRFDAAIATVTDLRLVRQGALFGIRKYDPARVLAPLPGMRVIKSGRTTGVTRGTVTSIRVDGVQINYGTQQAPRIAVFDDCLEIEGNNGVPFSLPGDSGSVILEEATGHPVALLFAGDGVHTTACELGPLCRRLRAWPV